ncbi:MAG: hypothetical protein WBL63_07725 [Candidatus Acidiferrum sp.]
MILRTWGAAVPRPYEEEAKSPSSEALAEETTWGDQGITLKNAWPVLKGKFLSVPAQEFRLYWGSSEPQAGGVPVQPEATAGNQ